MTSVPNYLFNQASFAFNRFLNNYQQTKEEASKAGISWNKLSSGDLDDIYRASYKALRKILRPILTRGPVDSEISPFLDRLMEQIPSYNPNYPIRQATILKNLRQEIRFQDSDLDKFWLMPKDKFLGWLSACHDHKLNYNCSLVFISWIWVLENYNVARVGKKRINLSMIEMISGLTKKTVKKYLVLLMKNGLIEFTNENEKYFAKSLPALPVSNYMQDLPRETPMISELEVEFGLDKIQSFKFLYQQPLNRYNPFLFSDPTRFVMHLEVLNMEVFLASVLSREDLSQLLTLKHHKKSRSRSINLRKERILKFFQALDISTPEGLAPHYKLLYEITPALHYIGRRKFETCLSSNESGQI